MPGLISPGSASLQHGRQDGTMSVAPMQGIATRSSSVSLEPGTVLPPIEPQLRSAVSSASASQSGSLAPPPRIRDQDASILLVGIRGTGKTSLALLAASCIEFRVVDADQDFYQATGMSRAAYLARCGLDEYRRHELELMRSLLRHNPTRCIIVCGPGSTDGAGQQLLVELGAYHPIIHVMRDAEDIARYLGTADVNQIARLSELASSSYMAASNYEFYNLSESLDTTRPLTSSRGSPPAHPSLKLKNVEQDFLRLIYSIRCQSARPRILQARNLVSFLPPESKPFTYALTVPLQSIPDIATRLRETDLAVDAMEIVVELDELVPDGQAFTSAAAARLTKLYYTLRRNIRLPVIILVAIPDRYWQSAAPHDAKPQFWSTYLQVVRHALRLAPDYLTLDLRCDPTAARDLIANKASTKVIGHYYDPTPEEGSWQSPARAQLLVTAAEWDCDLVRLSQYSTSRADNAAVQRFVHQSQCSGPAKVPVIAFNVGILGRQSCFNNSILTPVTHRLIEEAPANAVSRYTRPMLTVQEAQHALYSSFTLDGLVFGIFGSAVSATMSPPMHNAAFAFCNMPHTYRIYQSSTLSDLAPIVQDPNFGGASISAPFKKEIFSVLRHVSPEAQVIGAVNTIIPLRSDSLEDLVHRNQAGPVVALFGDNTDWIGLHTCVRRNLSPVNAANSRKTALILGAGGMAQAAIYAAIRLGVEFVFVHNRTLSKAEQLVRQFNGRIISVPNVRALRGSPSLSPRQSGTSTPNRQRSKPVRVQAIASMDDPWPAGFEPPTIIVSCIARVSVNGEPKADNTLPDTWLGNPTGGVAVELAYNPLETPLLKQVRSLSDRGWYTVHGLEVLPEQGYAQFELFTGRPAPRRLMEAQIVRHLETAPVP